MRDHFSAHPDWTPGRRYYSWFLAFDDQPKVHQLARAYQRHLHDPHLELVPPEWLHLTVHGVGDADEVTKEEAERIVDCAKSHCAPLAPFTIALALPV